jgi:hypothetical protein
MTHIDTAQLEGAKAGFNAYIAHLERSGLPGAKKTLATIKAQGNKKAQFAFYCNTFSAELANGAKANVESDEIEALRQRLAELETQEQNIATRVVNKVRKPRRKANELRVGDTFTYHGKESDSEWTVTGEGVTKKHKKPAFICSNGKRETPWNVKSVAVAIAEGRIERH